ncbi:hypothetical protein AOLI_G00036280 [Acnodon oligacanthus]
MQRLSKEKFLQVLHRPGSPAGCGTGVRYTMELQWSGFGSPQPFISPPSAAHTPTGGELSEQTAVRMMKEAAVDSFREGVVVNVIFPPYVTPSRCSQEIRQAILSVLPSLRKQTLSSLLEKLVSTGVECKSDLKLIKEEDLQELLRPIQCHKLLQVWSTEEEITHVTDLQSETSSSSSVDISRSPSFRNSFPASSTPSPASTNSRFSSSRPRYMARQL